MHLQTMIRRVFQSLGYDVQRIFRDDSAFIDPCHASISTVVFDGRAVRFLIADPTDTIQKHHVEGRFYEQDILEMISFYFPSGGVFVDVGANVGNHSIFAAAHLEASRVIAIEPMRRQHAILSINVLLNDVRHIVEVHKLALSDHEASARMITPNANNIGRSMISDTVYGEWVRLGRGDDLLAGRHVDFIKIDIEGHELYALAGLAETISRCRPVLLVEVADGNADAFESWLHGNRYKMLGHIRQHSENSEVLIAPDARSFAARVHLTNG